MNDYEDLLKTLDRRSNLTERLAAALAHLNRNIAIGIVASFIPLDEKSAMLSDSQNAATATTLGLAAG